MSAVLSQRAVKCFSRTLEGETNPRSRVAGCNKENMAYAAVQKHPRYRISVPVAVFDGRGEPEELTLEDISLGGVFIKTTRPQTPGSFVRMRIALGAQAPVLALMGRVVHVIDGVASLLVSRAPGMGVQFDGLSPDTERLLRGFVDGIEQEERRQRARRDVDRMRDEPAPIESSTTTAPREDVLELLAEADFLDHAGDHEEAVRVLQEAFDASPNDVDVQRKLDTAKEAQNARRAMDLLASSEGLPPDELVRAARRAVLVAPSTRDVLLRAMRVLARADSDADMVAVAELLLDLDADDEVALLALLHLHESKSRWLEAARAGEALLRIRPKDFALRAQVQRIVQASLRTK